MRVQTKITLIGVFIIFFALPAGFILISSQKSLETPVKGNSNAEVNGPKTVAQPETVKAPTTQKADLIIGDPDAPVTLTEYGDFQCPFCAQFNRQTEPSIIRDYVDTGKIKIRFRVETHIGPESVNAGEAAYCANEQDAFRIYHDELFKRQRGENKGAFSVDNLKLIASDLGLDKAGFDACLESDKHLSLVQESNQEARDRGVTNTPTIFIGEHKVVGAQPYAVYKALIDEQL